MASSKRFFSRNFLARSRFLVTSAAIGPIYTFACLSLVGVERFACGPNHVPLYTPASRRAKPQRLADAESAKGAGKTRWDAGLTRFFVCGKLGVYTACFGTG